MCLKQVETLRIYLFRTDSYYRETKEKEGGSFHCMYVFVVYYSRRMMGSAVDVAFVLCLQGAS